MRKSILIVGAGPTGLNLALQLVRRKAPFRIISEATGPGEQSRAMAVHARTLEFYGQLGFAHDVIDSGVPAERIHLRERAHGHSREVLSVSIKDLGDELSPYPFVLCYPQDDHERLLITKLEAEGVSVEWNTKLVGFKQDAEQVQAKLELQDGGLEDLQASYICGCDGAHSSVRETLRTPFVGGSYEQVFYVADVKIASGFDRDIYANLGKDLLALMFPVRSSGMQRLIGLVPPEMRERTDLRFDDLRPHIEPLLDVKVTGVNWFSTYHVHHRVAEKFYLGRAFLLGDAGHIHSPAGGQGMNTGIGDAVNLGWKLAAVSSEKASGVLLDTYGSERVPFAQRLVSTTDQAFHVMVGSDLRGEMTRQVFAPFVLSIGSRFAPTRHAAFRILSQIHIHYGESPLSRGKAGDVHGGDRLPWVKGQDSDGNFFPLRSMDWQVHVYGECQNELRADCESMGLPVHRFAWSHEAKSAGFERDAMYLVRPDGYVALASARQDSAQIVDLAKRFSLVFPALEALK